MQSGEKEADSHLLKSDKGCEHTLTRTHITPACIHVCTYVCLVQYIRPVLTQAKVYPPLVVISGVTMKCLVIVLVCAVIAEGIHRLVLTLFIFHSIQLLFSPKFSLKHNVLFSSLIVNDNSLLLYLPICIFRVRLHIWVYLCSCYPRIPLVKHKSIRERMMEKGERLPYQDPALKYFPSEFAGSATMYINNYADVRTCYNTQAYGLSRMLLNVLSMSTESIFIFQNEILWCRRT